MSDSFVLQTLNKLSARNLKTLAKEFKVPICNNKHDQIQKFIDRKYILSQFGGGIEDNLNDLEKEMDESILDLVKGMNAEEFNKFLQTLPEAVQNTVRTLKNSTKPGEANILDIPIENLVEYFDAKTLRNLVKAYPAILKKDKDCLLRIKITSARPLYYVVVDSVGQVHNDQVPVIYENEEDAKRAVLDIIDNNFLDSEYQEREFNVYKMLKRQYEEGKNIDDTILRELVYDLTANLGDEIRWGPVEYAGEERDGIRYKIVYKTPPGTDDENEDEDWYSTVGRWR